MSFGAPIWLWLLLLPIAALLPVWKRVVRAAPEARHRILRLQLSSTGIQPAAESAPAAKTYGMLWVAVALGIVALARPQWGTIEAPTFSQSREILIALDLSRSMDATDVSPSRLERARLLTSNLLESLKGERVGLIVFSGTAFLQSPLSADYEILREFLPSLKTDFLPQGGTDYGALLETALTSFSDEGGAQRFLIILSDGEATDDLWPTRLEELKKSKVRVIGLGLGTDSGSMIPDGQGGFVKDRFGAVVLSKLESATLRRLAAETDGHYAAAASWVELPRVIQDLVEKSEKGKFLETTRQRKVERYQWFLAAALIAFLWSLVREFPSGPLSRRRVMKAPAATAKPPAGNVVVSTVLFLTLWGVSTPAGEAQETSSAAAPVVALTKELSRAEHVSPKEWQRLANVTLDYARRAREAKEEVSTQSIRDALAAVANGEAEAPTLTDWQDLRNRLGDYLKPTPTPPEPTPTPTPKPSPTPQNNQNNQQNQNNQDQNGAKQPPTPSVQPTPPAPSPATGPEQSQGEQSRGQPTPPPAPAKEDKQKVGGSAQRPESKGSDSKTPSDPRLTSAQQKLDQLREADKPMELQQQLNRQERTQPRNTDKDW